MRFWLLVLAIWGIPTAALAHSWYSTKIDPVYRNSCCGGTDCNRLTITPSNIRAEADGYRIVLSLDETRKINPYSVAPIDALVKWERVQPSEDGNWHICVMTSFRADERGGIYCLFQPPSG